MFCQDGGPVSSAHLLAGSNAAGRAAEQKQRGRHARRRSCCRCRAAIAYDLANMEGRPRTALGTAEVVAAALEVVAAIRQVGQLAGASGRTAVAVAVQAKLVADRTLDEGRPPLLRQLLPLPGLALATGAARRGWLVRPRNESSSAAERKV